MGTDDEISPIEIRRIEARWKSDIEFKIDSIDRRLRIIERLVWIAVGGTFVISAIAMVGIGMLFKQADRIDSIALRQASAIAERVSNEAALRQKDLELQAQIDFLRNGKK